MRKTLLLIFASLLLLTVGCAASINTDLTATHKAVAAAPSQAATSAAGASGGALLVSRPPLPGWAAPYKNKLVYGVITKRRAVALTIDDIGAPEMKALVDALVANHLHATLFCIGSKMTTEAATYAAANGMELGDHSWIHNSIGHYAPVAANEQIIKTARLLRAGAGEWPIWYRSPFNLYQSQGMRSVAAAGMLVAFDSNDPLDYHGYTGKPLVDRISVKLKPGQIILLHHYPQTIATLPAIAAELRRKNYEVMTLSELAQTGTPATEASQLKSQHGVADLLERLRARLARLFGQ